MLSESGPPYGRLTQVRSLSGVLAVFVLVALAGCGDEDPYAAPTPSVSSSAATASVAQCPATSSALTKAKVVANADLDGDGVPDQVKLTPAGSDCPNLLVAETGHGLLAAQVPTDGPPVRSVLAMKVPGTRADVLVTRQEHPRGGFQVRLFAFDGSTMRELRHDDNPLLPFVATDVQEHPYTVDCGDSGLVKTEAVPREGRGDGFAWDIRRTTYEISNGEVTETSSRELQAAVSPEELERKYQPLSQHAFFESCQQG